MEQIILIWVGLGRLANNFFFVVAFFIEKVEINWETMSSNHKQRYKNAALDSKELRRRREEEGLQLRKQKREQQLFKKRNVNPAAETEEAGNDVSRVFFLNPVIKL